MERRPFSTDWVDECRPRRQQPTKRAHLFASRHQFVPRSFKAQVYRLGMDPWLGMPVAAAARVLPTHSKGHVLKALRRACTAVWVAS